MSLTNKEFAIFEAMKAGFSVANLPSGAQWTCDTKALVTLIQAIKHSYADEVASANAQRDDANTRWLIALARADALAAELSATKTAA